MRYLLLSVLVVCVIGVMVPSVSASEIIRPLTEQDFIDQKYRQASDANERERIAELERWENLPFFEKHSNWIMLGVFIAVIGVIVCIAIGVRKMWN